MQTARQWKEIFLSLKNKYLYEVDAPFRKKRVAK